ncbi:hypothetical protein Y032_0505g2671 [Ancylostoma ceylanicum]|nr:hypothetical protein Y032_0505g2671 [Ancylostoma ceylanicum]
MVANNQIYTTDADVTKICDACAANGNNAKCISHLCQYEYTLDVRFLHFSHAYALLTCIRTCHGQSLQALRGQVLRMNSPSNILEEVVVVE